MRETFSTRAARFIVSEEVSDSEGFCGKLCFTRFLKRLFGRKYIDKRHSKIVKQMEERNKTIFHEVMKFSSDVMVR